MTFSINKKYNSAKEELPKKVKDIEKNKHLVVGETIKTYKGMVKFSMKAQIDKLTKKGKDTEKKCNQKLLMQRRVKKK